MKKFIDSLEDLLVDNISEDGFQELYKYDTLKYPFNEILIILDHYFSDSDIRLKDDEYKEMQNNELRKLIYCLKNNKIEKALSKINFLHKSDIDIA